MIQIPAMVAFQHGAGGIAAFLVSLLELTRGLPELSFINQLSGILGLSIGSLTFSGSMIASAKLANKMRQTPQILPRHTQLVLINALMLVLVGLTALWAPYAIRLPLYVVQIGLGIVFGVIFSIRIGGADMPVLISFLNATAGLAAAFCGMVIENQLLIAFGATVAASGSILTHVMCKAMNRKLARVFVPQKHPGTGTGGKLQPTAKKEPDMPASASVQKSEHPSGHDDDLDRAAQALRTASTVIIVPGYGMALAQAQQDVVALAQYLTEQGKDVVYAIHPVAGRMPGHMNVLLAEAGVEYDMLAEMEEVNPRFASTDVALVVGACDVVNPAAIEVEGTPISGMPILLTHQARNIICCNLDQKPGYSGVDNPLYHNEKTIMLLGDAKTTIQSITARMSGKKGTEDQDSSLDQSGANTVQDAVDILAGAKKVIIIPGYGMALAQAQFKVAELAVLLEERGAKVLFAIHPVAGRMPGHMNVMLAEAEVDYEKLLEMDEANPKFPDTDAVLIFGACDVVNPAAIQKEGTPISGMPILMAHEAKHVIICNYDQKPGYSGEDNPLYTDEKTIPLFGDALQTATKLIEALSSGQK
jgi:NAD(P) transhydrogenase subunit beta